MLPCSFYISRGNYQKFITFQNTELQKQSNVYKNIIFYIQINIVFIVIYHKCTQETDLSNFNYIFCTKNIIR